MLEAQLLAARALYLNGNLDAAQRKAADVLRGTPDAYMCHLLICSIYVHQDKPQLAMAALDQVGGGTKVVGKGGGIGRLRGALAALDQVRDGSGPLTMAGL